MSSEMSKPIQIRSERKDEPTSFSQSLPTSRGIVSQSLPRTFSAKSISSSPGVIESRKKISLTWDTLTPSTSTDSLDVSDKWKALGNIFFKYIFLIFGVS